MKSRIVLDERVVNKDRNFGSSLGYFPAWVFDFRGQRKPALFTRDQIKTAMIRAEENPEDVPVRTFWQRVRDKLHRVP